MRIKRITDTTMLSEILDRIVHFYLNFRYFDHMIIGMPRQLYDGLIEF